MPKLTGRVHGRRSCLRRPFLVSRPAAAFEHVGQRSERDRRATAHRRVPAPPTTARSRWSTARVDVSHRRRGEAERPVGGSVAGDGDAGHHGQLGERRQQPVALGGGVSISRRCAASHTASHRCGPAARRRERIEAGIRRQASAARARSSSPDAADSVARAAMKAGSGSATVVESTRSSSRSSSSLPRPWSQRIATSCAPYEPERIGVTDVAPELVAGRRPARSASSKPSLANRQHDVDRGDHDRKGRRTGWRPARRGARSMSDRLADPRRAADRSCATSARSARRAGGRWRARL